MCNIYSIRRTLHADNDSLRHPHITFDKKGCQKDGSRLIENVAENNLLMHFGLFFQSSLYNHYTCEIDNKEPIENCIKLQDVFKLFISMGLTDLQKAIPFLARKLNFHTNIKVTLHFRNNIWLKR